MQGHDFSSKQHLHLLFFHFMGPLYLSSACRDESRPSVCRGASEVDGSIAFSFPVGEPHSAGIPCSIARSSACWVAAEVNGSSAFPVGEPYSAGTICISWFLFSIFLGHTESLSSEPPAPGEEERAECSQFPVGEPYSACVLPMSVPADQQSWAGPGFNTLFH